MDDEQNKSDPKLSRNELAKKMRRAAYDRAKAFRATDPKQVAFKEAMKQRRRDANEVAKEQRKTATREQKAATRGQPKTSSVRPRPEPASDEAVAVNERAEQRAALLEQKTAAREQLIALRAQTATAREQLVAMRLLTGAVAEERAGTRQRASVEQQKLAERTALERRLMMKIVPASKLE